MSMLLCSPRNTKRNTHHPLRTFPLPTTHFRLPLPPPISACTAPRLDLCRRRRSSLLIMPSADGAALAPLVDAQLNHLRSHSPVSISAVQIRSGSNPPSHADRFTLLVPFCLGTLKWDVIYNALHPTVAPDIVFSEGDSDFNPLDGDGLSWLDQWDARDPVGLLNLVNEIRELYRLYQWKRVEEVDDARLKFEISAMSHREGIEVSLMSGPGRTEEVKFAVPLDIDLNKLAPFCHWKHQQRIYVEVVFPVCRDNSADHSAPSLKLVSSIDLKTLFSVEDVKLPAWSGTCMAEYIPTLEEKVKAQVLDAVTSIPARRCFIEALAPVFGRPLEADPIFCRKATVLSVSGSFVFLIHFSLPTQFPKQKPTLTLQSCQVRGVGRPITSSPENFPWSPRWEPAELVDHIFDFLVDECLRFKSYCSDALAKSN